MKCKLVDVFTNKKLSGNGLTIFYDFDYLSTDKMLSLTQEMRQFESIFVTRKNNDFYARIFTLDEELDFAGHPLIGLAAHLHEEYSDEQTDTWEIILNKKSVKLTTKVLADYYEVTMEQGRPEFINALTVAESAAFLSALNLNSTQVANYPLEVISTGLPYLIIPIKSGIDSVRVCHNNLEVLLAEYSAKFVYIIDTQTFEGRTWDNQGKVEDIATGSAAGPVGAFLYKHNLVSAGESFIIKQGRFLMRPSEIKVIIKPQKNDFYHLSVTGQVCKIANVEFV